MPSSTALRIILPDGGERTFTAGVTAAGIAAATDPRLLDGAVAAAIDGRVVGLDQPLEQGGRLRFLTFADEEGREVYRDGSGQPVTTPRLEALGLEPGGSGDEEENLISTLLALVPEVVAVHRAPQSPPEALLETLRGVFGERLDGCRFCQDSSTA